jgi:phage baseplate assembly protein W
MPNAAPDTIFSIPDTLIYSKRKQSLSTYSDVNPLMELGQPDLIYDSEAILAAIRNLFMCPIGARGPIFNPTFGSMLYQLLQEPYDEVTAHRIDSAVRQAIVQWEPRVNIMSVSVVTDDTQPGYIISLVLEIAVTGKVITGSYAVPV